MIQSLLSDNFNKPIKAFTQTAEEEERKERRKETLERGDSSKVHILPSKVMKVCFGIMQ